MVFVKNLLMQLVSNTPKLLIKKTLQSAKTERKKRKKKQEENTCYY